MNIRARVNEDILDRHCRFLHRFRSMSTRIECSQVIKIRKEIKPFPSEKLGGEGLPRIDA
jgi:hypothetical protein